MIFLDDCPECGNKKDERYQVCAACHKKRMQAEPKSNGPSELSKLNNNLYAIRRLLNYQVQMKYGKTLAWNGQKKDFEFRDIKGSAK